MGALQETILSKFGSRFVLRFKPQEKKLYASPWGIYFEKSIDFALGIKVGMDVNVLPFTDRFPSFKYIYQDITPTSVTFYARKEMDIDSRKNDDMEFKAAFISPFYPQDIKVSCAPFIYLDIEVTNIGNKPKTGQVFLDSVFEGYVEKSENTVSNMDNYSLKERIYKSIMNGAPDYNLNYSILSHKGEIAIYSKDGNFTKDFSLQPGESIIYRFIIAGYVEESCLLIKGEPYKFKYKDYFKSIYEIINYALSEEQGLRSKSDIFNDTITNLSLGKDISNLLSYAFLTYIANTWYCTNGVKDWFSVWEGNCIFHSTVDLAYNIEPFSLLYWPDLLRMQIDEWSEFKQNGYILHDMGAGLNVNGQAYSHSMEIEENCNFLLMLYSLWRSTGDISSVMKHYDLCKELCEFVFQADTTGNGFPNKFVANTIDDGSPAIQLSKEQTYLAVKSSCAVQVSAIMAEAAGDEIFSQKCQNFAKVNLKTLEENAWLGDHYSVCIDKNSDDLFYFETGQEPGGELEGWDAYSIYTSNGLFYPMICNTSLDFDYDRLGTDIINAVHESLTLFGCTHSSSDKSNVWISQNLWRDFTAAYLGVDLLDLMQRYWSFQVFENTQGRGNCFFETVGWNTLCNYPRGLAAFGVFFALGALGVDKVEKIISLKPIRVPSKFPLLQFADWKNKRIPWVNTFIDRGVIQVDVFEDDLLDGFNIKVYENVHNKISKI